MLNVESIRFIIGILGNVTSFGLFISPVPTFWKIIKDKSVAQFKPDPYVAGVLNCMMWVWYGLPLVHPNSILVVTINGTGLVLELAYLAIFFTFCNWATRRKVILALLVEFLFMAAIVFVTLHFFHTHEKRSAFVGTLCVVFGIIMYLSPMTVMKNVIKTKSVKYMPFYLSLANFFNGLIWGVYALLKFDPYILIPNGLGAFAGLLQLMLYAAFYKTTKWDEDDDMKQSELELPRTS